MTPEQFIELESTKLSMWRKIWERATGKKQSDLRSMEDLNKVIRKIHAECRITAGISRRCNEKD